MGKDYKIGISTTVDYTIDIYSQLKLFSQAGFQFISLGARSDHCHFFDSEKFREIAGNASELRLFIESAHAPFWGEYDITSSEENISRSATEKMIEFMNYAADYGIPIVIIHPHHFFQDDRQACFERAANALSRILLTKPDGIFIAIENLPREDGSWICTQLLETFDSSRVGFCYDSSHENISGDPFHLLKKHYNRLTTCHLSDNQGFSDQHLVPGDGNINWTELKSYFDKAPQIQNILFEVGTGEKLAEPIDTFIMRTSEKARMIFN